MSSDYVSIHVARATRNALQQLQLRWSADAGRRITLTEVLDVVTVVAERHPDEVATALTST